MADRAAITINADAERVRSAWQTWRGDAVDLRPAPGDQGTEVRAEIPEDDLRRFKQMIETGEVLHGPGVQG